MSIMPMILIAGSKSGIKINNFDSLPPAIWQKFRKESIPTGAAIKGMLSGLIGNMLESIPVATQLKETFERSVAPSVSVTVRYRNVGANFVVDAPNLSSLISS
jgi:hypothetical protein